MRDNALMRNRLAVVVWVLVLLGVGGGLFWAAGKLAKVETAKVAEKTTRPTVTLTRPAAGSKDVSLIDGIAADIRLVGTAGVDPGTLGGITLTRVRDGANIPLRANTTGSGDALIAKPIDPLELGTEYEYSVSDGVKDSVGAAFQPYKMRFTTAASFKLDAFPAAFEKVELPNTKQERNAYTGLAIGPDGLLYAGSFGGVIYRFGIEQDGTLSPREPVMAVIGANKGPRLITGITFDPASTKDKPILWVNHGQMVPPVKGKIEGAQDWTGKLSRLSGADLSQYEDVLIGLPRAYKDHLNFQIAFDKAGMLYFTQASHTSVGDVDQKWGYRPEHKLTAAVLRLDTTRVRPTGNPAIGSTRAKTLVKTPIDVQTDEGRSYDPAAADAPLTLFATGVRSGYDLLFHRNGHLYSGINGAAGNEGNTPASPDGKVVAIRDLKQTTDDVLLKIEQGGYYGHPNPSRGEYVLMGGNPTAGSDPMEVPEYPVGTLPDKNFRRPAYVFGKNNSPNGLIEYQQPGSPLDGCILVTRYSNGKDVIALKLNAAGDVSQTITNLDGLTGLRDPLDLIQHNGDLYVAEYSGQAITLLRAKAGGNSTQTQITSAAPPAEAQ
jgi:glucose/arabinose dehydrogenase